MSANLQASKTVVPTWLADVMPWLPEATSAVAIIVSLVAIRVSVATSRNLQERQQRFELLATCLEDLSQREKKAAQFVRSEVLGEYDEDSTWSHYEAAVEVYGLMKHHLPDIAALEEKIKRVEHFRSRFRRGKRSTPDGDWALSDALAMEAHTFVWLLKDAVAKALYGTDPPPQGAKWWTLRSASKKGRRLSE